MSFQVHQDSILWASNIQRSVMKPKDTVCSRWIPLPIIKKVAIILHIMSCLVPTHNCTGMWIFAKADVSKMWLTWNGTYQNLHNKTKYHHQDECNQSVLQWKTPGIPRGRCMGSMLRNTSFTSEGWDVIPQEWSHWPCSTVAKTFTSKWLTSMETHYSSIDGETFCKLHGL